MSSLLLLLLSFLNWLGGMNGIYLVLVLCGELIV